MSTDIEVNQEKQLLREIAETSNLNLKDEIHRLQEALEKESNTVRILKESLINLEKLYYENCAELRKYKPF